ncbi:uncharacterized protein M6G45_002009 [Spheniscus humboldti]
MEEHRPVILAQLRQGLLSVTAAVQPHHWKSTVHMYDTKIIREESKGKLWNKKFKQWSLGLTGSMSFSSQLRLSHIVERHERIPVQLRWT